MYRGPRESELLSDTVQKLISESTRDNTKTKYRSITKRWMEYCGKRLQNYRQGTTPMFLNFLAFEYERGLKYATLKGYKAALIDFLNKDIDENQIRKFFKGVFNNRPPTSKYVCIWDVDILLAHLDVRIISSELDLSKKLATLLMILSGNRVNCLTNLKVTNMFLTDSECTFVFDSVMKHSRPNFNDKPLVFRAFPHNKSICPVHVINEYLQVRLTRSAVHQLLITTTQPYREAKSDTIANWIKMTMADSGIGTGTFQTHRCRAASTSAAAYKGVGLKIIMKSHPKLNIHPKLNLG